MRYKKFGSTGLNISALTIGTYGVGNAAWGETSKDAYMKAIRKMVELGANHIDTAINYGGGESERTLGKIIGEFRDKVYVTSKGCFALRDGKIVRDASRENMLRSCDISLERLGLDYLDMYLVHQPDPNTPIAETMDALNTLKKQGKVRFIGVSNYDLDMLKEACRYAEISAIQVQYSMVSRANQALMEWAAAHGIGIMTHGSLGAGILTGAFRICPNFPETDVRSYVYDYFKEPKFSRIMKLIDVMDQISVNHDSCPLAQIAVNWQIQKDFVSTALVGVRSEQEAIENCGGMDWTLTTDEMKMIDNVIVANGI